MRRVPWREAVRPADYVHHPIRVASPDAVLAQDAELAVTLRHRLRGLIGRDRFEPGQALIIDRCRQVHMRGVTFPIEAVFCDSSLRVVGIERLEPGHRSRRFRRSRYCIGLPEGTCERCGVAPGVSLRFEPH